MKIRKIQAAIATAVLMMMAAPAMAGLTQAEADMLGKELTPVGAERAGNKDGTIPAWDGGLTKPPAGWDPAMGYADPYAKEKPLFVITGQNADQYKDRLTAGELALLKKYPNYKMPVYPTHRTAALPKSVTDHIKEESTKVSLNGMSIEHIDWQGPPFPIPKNGLEAIYNHLLRYFPSLKRTTDWIPVRASGDFYTVRFTEKEVPARYFDQKTFEGHQYSFFGYYESPATLIGTIYLVHDPVDRTRADRQAWIYNAGQRRVRRAPDLAYDNIDDGTEGMRTTDQYGGYSGAPDRYDWKLVGKKEVYVGYNTYKLSDKKLKYSEIIQKNTINSDLMRYELHRVWVVEASLKPGMSHVYSKRTFYLDEDSWHIVHEDSYDGRGNLWRVTMLPIMPRYDALLPWYHFAVTHDLTNGQYLVSNLDNEVKTVPEYGFKAKWTDFQAEALRRAGVR